MKDRKLNGKKKMKCFVSYKIMHVEQAPKHNPSNFGVEDLQTPETPESRISCNPPK